MGCKGKKRRERNYLKAHGQYTPLAPPPTAKDIDAIPSKLRRLLQFKNSSASKSKPSPSGRDVGHIQNKSSSSGDKKLRGKGNKKQIPATILDSKEKLIGEIKGKNEELKNKQSVMQRSVQSAPSNRKRKRGDELRLLLESQNLTPGKRKRNRRKEFLEKRKKKKAKSDDDMDFPQHEVIKFGEIVNAPPKLVFPKKAFGETKVRQDVSQERLRLKAIETYRQRKGWVTRPGSHVPPLEISHELSEA